MWLRLAIVTLLAAVVQGVAGFGFTLLALFVYLLALPAADAVQLVLLINFVITAVLLSRLWRRVPRRAWAWLAGGGALGFPFGLWWFARADTRSIELAMAIVTLLFSFTVLVRELGAGRRSAGGAPEAVRPRSVSALLVGAAAGAMAAALGAPGPPVAIYLAGLGIDKTTFRALALASFVVMQVLAIAGQIVFVGMPPGVWWHALFLAPLAVVGAGIGHLVSRRISERRFRRCVLVLLLAAGTYMLYRAGGR